MRISQPAPKNEMGLNIYSTTTYQTQIQKCTNSCTFEHVCIILLPEKCKQINAFFKTTTFSCTLEYMANSCTVYFQAQCMFVFSRHFQFMYHANFMNGMFDDTPADTI